MNNELQFNSILDQIPTITYKDSINGTRTIISISPKSEAILGYSLTECKNGNKAFINRLYSEDRQRVQSILSSKDRKSPFAMEYRLVSKGGQPVWFRDVSVLRPGPSDDPDHFFGIMFDITDFKQTENALLVHSKRLKTLQEIERAILAVQSPEKTAQTVLQRIREIVPCSRASVTLFDFETKQFNVLAAIFIRKTKFQPGGSVPLNTIKKEIEVLKKGDVFHVEDINTLKDPSLHIQRLKEEGMRTYIHVPLLSQKILIGSLNLGDNFPNAFTLEHIQIVQELANAMAISIEQARLFKRNNEQSEQLRQISLRLAEIENAERKRLAGELHDQVGQNLTAINKTFA